MTALPQQALSLPTDRARRLVIVTDAWRPQMNGVVRTLEATMDYLQSVGHDVTLITPAAFRSVPCPSYPEIRLSLASVKTVGRMIDAARPDSIHISTEGPLGFAARSYCLKRGLNFTTAYHTKFPEYVRARIGMPLAWSYAALRRFHAPSAAVMCATASLADELAARGISHTMRWSRGVDINLYRPERRAQGLPAVLQGLARPILLYVGRVAVEKNLEAFLRLKVLGQKVVVGDGPALPDLQRRFPDVCFTGAKHGDELADIYAGADVFVFPSLTDTFGLVILEALASGTPVAAYPVTGPRDIIDGHPVGCLDHDLGRAVEGALSTPRANCRRLALLYSWEACSRQFLSNLVAV